MNFKTKYILFVCLFVSVIGNAQPGKLKNVTPEDAELAWSNKDYIDAANFYEVLCKREPDNMEYFFRAGFSLLNTHHDKALAIPYFEKVAASKKVTSEVYFLLGKANHIAMKFDEAEKYYVKFKNLVVKDKAETEKVNHHLDMLHNAEEITKHPLNVSFVNLGPEINSQFPDYHPWITSDEQILYFTTRRKGAHATAIESDGYYSSDVFMSSVLEGKWDKAKNLGTGVNTNLDEQIVGIKPDGSELIVYVDRIDQKEDLFRSVRKGPTTYSKLEKLSPNVSDAKEYSGSVFDTENGPVLFFSRNDKNSLGGTDIYMAKMLPNGQWALPRNLGPNINSKYNEEFPYLALDGKTLYFSSEGHSSIGGYDLFKSIWDEEAQAWGPPINLGYPVNTCDDDEQISILPDNRAGYISTVRAEGYGDLDIYRIKFEDEEQKYNLFRGKINRSDSTNTNDIAVIITAVESKTNQEYTFTPNPHSGKYIMALLPGKYTITVTSDGYKEITDKVQVFDFGIIHPETIKDYLLQKQ